MKIDVAYAELIQKVLYNGELRPTRAVITSSGKRADALTLFGNDGHRGLSLVVPSILDELPILTTKKVWFHGIKHELLWMLRGETNIASLHAANVHIWDGWADPATGEVAEVYGRQWRNWNDKVDQIANLIADIEVCALAPEASAARRLILTGWNVERVPQMRLPPCHTLAQWDVNWDYLGRPLLDCALYMRSCDAFLGLPFNVVQYALLTSLLAAVTGREPGSLTIHFGNLHIYENHLGVIGEQLAREPIECNPRVRISSEIDRTLLNVDPAHIELIGYESHPALPGEVAV